MTGGGKGEVSSLVAFFCLWRGVIPDGAENNILYRVTLRTRYVTRSSSELNEKSCFASFVYCTV